MSFDQVVSVDGLAEGRPEPLFEGDEGHPFPSPVLCVPYHDSPPKRWVFPGRGSAGSPVNPGYVTD